MRSSKLIMKNIAQKVMVKFGFGRKFHDLKHFEVGDFFSYSLTHINMRTTLQKIVKKHQFNVIFIF